MTHFEQVIEHYGSRAELARRLGVTKGYITNIGNEHGGGFPPRLAVLIEQQTGGFFKAVEISKNWCGRD